MLKLEIPRRSRKCHKGEEELFPGMEYCSTLTDGEEGNYLRRDFCIACWQGLSDEERGETHWRSKIPKKEEETLPKDRDDRAMALLKQLRATSLQEAFVLALFLVRRKRLIWRQEVEPDGEKFDLYEEVGTEEMIPVKKIPLTDIETAKIQEQIADRLRDG